MSRSVVATHVATLESPARSFDFGWIMLGGVWPGESALVEPNGFHPSLSEH
jgi:hypothetical protein